MFHSDNLKKSSKMIIVEVFQNSHSESVSQWQPKKGSKVINMEVFQKVIVKVFHSGNL